MTHLVMDQQATRSRRWPFALAVCAFAALLGGAIWLQFRDAAQTRDLEKAKAVASEEANLPSPAPAPALESAPPPAPATPATQPPPAEPLAPPPAATAQSPAPELESAVALLREAEALRAADRLQAAREKALAALEMPADDATRVALETLLGEVGIALVTTPRPMPEKTDYTVQPGDSLGRIARRFGTTVELIEKSNQLRSSVIRPGDRLRIFSGAWSIRVNKTRNDLVLSLNDRFFKRYRVGTGEYAKTPTGQFKITDRIPQPTWWRPDGRTIPYGDPENLLGTHWLALDVKGYGLHGTWEPETIGRQSSLGCVRLLNEDIAEIFTLVPVGTPVLIEE